MLFDGCVAGPLQTITYSHRSMVEMVRSALRNVMQDAMSEVLKVYAQLKLKVYVDEIKIHVWEKNQDVLQTVPHLVSKLESVIQGSKIKLSLMKGVTEWQSKLIASNRYLESDDFQRCKDEMSYSVNIWEQISEIRRKSLGNRNRVEKEVHTKNWYHREHKRILKGLHNDRYQQSFADVSGCQEECGSLKLQAWRRLEEKYYEGN